MPDRYKQLLILFAVVLLCTLHINSTNNVQGCKHLGRVVLPAHGSCILAEIRHAMHSCGTPTRIYNLCIQQTLVCLPLEALPGSTGSANRRESLDGAVGTLQFTQDHEKNCIPLATLTFGPLYVLYRNLYPKNYPKYQYPANQLQVGQCLLLLR
jgi:hypothetical protein